MSAFKAYDIRGIYNKDFNKQDVYRMGFYLPQLLNVEKVIVGRDVRVSSPEIFEALVQGITDAGADVYNLGLSTTPMVYYFTAKHKFSASVQITASHNPKEHNGLKVSRENALPVGFDTGLGELQKRVESGDKIVPVAIKGKIIEYNVIDEYIAFQKTYLKDLSNLNIAIDCSNGMGALLAKDVFGAAPHYIYDTLDGTFPNHEPNPLEEENVEDLKHLVLKEKCDIGVIFDGDADRVMFVDEKGRFIRPDLTIAVLASYFITEKGQKGNVLQDIRTSKSVSEYITSLGATMHMWRVGRAYAAIKLREIDGIYGGELAGHYYFRDFYYSDSGMLAAILVLDIVSDLKREGKTLSELIDQINTYANSGEINFKINQKEQAMEALRTYFCEQEKATAFFDFDGYRIEFNDWWFNVRPSNTEPYLRFIAEAKSETLLKEKIKIAEDIIHKFD
ncbi:MAG: phosphomannomutase/phosphoglucomutase [Bacteroidota bacterium]